MNTRKKIFVSALLFTLATLSFGQVIPKTMLRLPDTGQTGDYTATPGEDADYTINPPFFLKNGNGTVTDTVTGLMWQQTDGGEMTVENAAAYCDTLTLGGYSDWRLPTAHEAFSILNHGKTNPALDPAIFTVSGAEYWWTGTKQANDASRIWVTNAGGGIGNHPKSETISAGGSKKFHTRAVRDAQTPAVVSAHFTDLGDGSIRDNLTNLIWQKFPLPDTLTWEQALNYAEGLPLAGQDDWRLPNIKELQSINDESLINPSVNTAFFSTIGEKKYWSSTTLPNQSLRAWYLDTRFGITTYELKTRKLNLICVRGNSNSVVSSHETADGARHIPVYPNPFTATLQVPPEYDNTVFILTDCFGNRVFSGKEMERQDFSGLAKGIYFLHIVNEPGACARLVKF